MIKYKVTFNDGSPPEIIEADKFYAEHGAFFFKEIRQECKVVFSKVIKVIPMSRVIEVTTEEVVFGKV